jgi:hypothetical protein
MYSKVISLALEEKKELGMQLRFFLLRNADLQSTPSAE